MMSHKTNQLPTTGNVSEDTLDHPASVKPTQTRKLTQATHRIMNMYIIVVLSQ